MVITQIGIGTTPSGSVFSEQDANDLATWSAGQYLEVYGVPIEGGIYQVPQGQYFMIAIQLGGESMELALAVSVDGRSCIDGHPLDMSNLEESLGKFCHTYGFEDGDRCVFIVEWCEKNGRLRTPFLANLGELPADLDHLYPEPGVIRIQVYEVKDAPPSGFRGGYGHSDISISGDEIPLSDKIVGTLVGTAQLRYCVVPNPEMLV